MTTPVPSGPRHEGQLAEQSGADMEKAAAARTVQERRGFMCRGRVEVQQSSARNALAADSHFCGFQAERKGLRIFCRGETVEVLCRGRVSMSLPVPENSAP